MATTTASLTNAEYSSAARLQVAGREWMRAANRATVAMLLLRSTVFVFVTVGTTSLPMLLVFAAALAWSCGAADTDTGSTLVDAR